MNFLSYTNNHSKDDYLTDIKTEEHMPSFKADISDISWATNAAQLFALTTWDGELRVFEVVRVLNHCLSQKILYKFNAPALKCAWNDQDTLIFVGLLDGSIKSYDLNTSQVLDVARENSAITTLCYVPGMNAVLSSGY